MIILQYRYGVRDSQFLLEQQPSVLREALRLIGRLFFQELVSEQFPWDILAKRLCGIQRSLHFC
jgi:hypothetical protein